MRHQAFLLAILFTATAVGGEIRVADFSKGDLRNWEEKSFSGNSEYRIVTLPAKRGQALLANTRGAASGLFKEVQIDLRKTPYLHWSWQVQNTFTGNDEHSKTGDDYPARIYVVVSGGLLFWKTRAINYVWSSNQPSGSRWPNAYTGNARMFAVRSGTEQLGQWLFERRNVREDLRQAFGENIDHIDAVAVMIDGDNTGQSASAYFGDIYFSSD